MVAICCWMGGVAHLEIWNAKRMPFPFGGGRWNGKSWWILESHMNSTKIWKYQESQESWYLFSYTITVNGRNPKQPPGMCKKPLNNGISTTNLDWLAGFLPWTVSPQNYWQLWVSSQVTMVQDHHVAVPLHPNASPAPPRALRWKPTFKSWCLRYLFCREV